MTFTMCAGESLFPLSLFVTVHVIGVGVVVPLHAPPVAEVEGEGHAVALDIPNNRPMRSTTAPPAKRAVFLFIVVLEFSDRVDYFLVLLRDPCILFCPFTQHAFVMPNKRRRAGNHSDIFMLLGASASRNRQVMLTALTGDPHYLTAL